MLTITTRTPLSQLVNLKVLKEGKMDVVVALARKFIEAVRVARVTSDK